MKDLFVFGMGFLSGWATRMSVDSMREGAVDLIAAGYRGAERLRVRVETEREFLQDLLAEGRARYESERSARPGPVEAGPEGEEDPTDAATARVRAA